MKTLIKICGLSNQESVDVAVQSGADLIGFVFAKTSPRCISPAQASQLSQSIPGQVKTTAVMLHPSATEVQEVLDRFQPDYLQTDAKDFAYLNLPEGCRPLKVYRDLPQFNPNEIDPNELSLFEGKNSGVGELVDTDRAADVAQHALIILAGGLNPSNVANVLQAVQPQGVDVSSGVESK
ncbi:MAG TPA: phosphoribosylanthranilate isomerase, partial [Gammaproteobacteria bacterium]|nr:phosphoribosylanthranilate isomerase [Gammaproteobacteria bacterium]